MRTYLIDHEQNEIVFDITKTLVHSSELVEYEFCAIEENKVIDKQTIFLRKLAGSFFVSTDGKSWGKLAKQDLPSRVVHVDTVFNVFRGYKPSGLGGAGAGELKTQMPGKVVKILVNEGDKVIKGQTMLILEAMKMENEIKCGIDGVVRKIHVKNGDTLESGVLMMEVEE